MAFGLQFHSLKLNFCQGSYYQRGEFLAIHGRKTVRQMKPNQVLKPILAHCTHLPCWVTASRGGNMQCISNTITLT